VVDHVACNGEVTALSTVTLKVEGSDEVLTKFCASTLSSQENNAPPNGQVLIFNVHPKDATSGKMLTVMSRLDVQGCIYAITSVNGLLAVAKDSSVRYQSLTSSLIPKTSIGPSGCYLAPRAIRHNGLPVDQAPRMEPQLCHYISVTSAIRPRPSPWGRDQLGLRADHREQRAKNGCEGQHAALAGLCQRLGQSNGHRCQREACGRLSSADI
jgi:hypothetical protein